MITNFINNNLNESKYSISITQEDINKCNQFIFNLETQDPDYIQSLSNKYNQPKEKILNDSYIGKLGEIAVSKYLLANHDINLQPDFSIHSFRSFNSDLGDGINIKTCRIDSKFPESYIFKKNDVKQIKKKNKHKELIIFVLIDELNCTSYIRSILKYGTLIKYSLFHLPQKVNLMGKLRCVYFDRLLDVQKSL